MITESEKEYINKITGGILGSGWLDKSSGHHFENGKLVFCIGGVTVKCGKYEITREVVYG